MWMQVVYLCEVFATLACIHSIYGEKVRWNIKPIVLCMSLMVIYEVANNIQNGGIFSLIAYIPIFLYCKGTFGKSVLQTLVKMIWVLIFLTVIEFICLLVVGIVFQNMYIRNIIASFLTLVTSVIVLPIFKISKVKFNSRFAIGIVGIILGIIYLLILEGKIILSVNMTLFILVIPSVLILLILLTKWTMSQAEVESMRQEVIVANSMDEKYVELVDDIRIRQHGIKNHITAILSAHYTYKTYEKLVEVQDEYCNKLMKENKYSNLLQISNRVLAGFLYDKFREMEENNVEVIYEICSHISKCTIPSYYLIEIVGTLLDNAAEAAECSERNVVIFKVHEDDNKYLVKVLNMSKYVSYAEIEKWFKKGVSSKGSNRGLGLYHVKNLCQEIGCDICCRNLEYEQRNWIEFTLEIGKADSE